MVDNNWDAYGDEAWDENALMEDLSQPPIQVSANIDHVNVLSSNDIKPAFEKKIKDWLSLYDLDFDSMVIVARHFGWSEDRLFEWFEKKDTLTYKLGITPIQESKMDPQSRASLMKNNKDNLCTSCYE